MTSVTAWLALALGSVNPVPSASRQMVVVVTSDVEAVDGVLQRHERTASDAPWVAVGEPVPVVLGPSGLGSGVGLHSSPLPGLPVKREGDGRSPAGVFALTDAFGFAETAALRVRYTKLTPATECVDDHTSRYYNQIVPRDAIDAPDWSSSERMRSIPDYVWGVVVDHNPDALPGAGSCIFLHVWSAPGEPTAGCTAMPPDAMESLAAWLDPAAHPVLVQLTRDLSNELGERWGLPAARSNTDSP